MFFCNVERKGSLLVKSSLIALTTAACNVSSFMVGAVHSEPFSSKRLTHLQTIDL